MIELKKSVAQGSKAIMESSANLLVFGKGVLGALKIPKELMKK